MPSFEQENGISPEQPNYQAGDSVFVVRNETGLVEAWKVAEALPGRTYKVALVDEKGTLFATKSGVSEEVLMETERKVKRAQDMDTDFETAQTLEDLYSLIREKGIITLSDGTMYDSEKIIEEIEEGHCGTLTRNGNLRYAALRLRLGVERE